MLRIAEGLTVGSPAGGDGRGRGERISPEAKAAPGEVVPRSGLSPEDLMTGVGIGAGIGALVGLVSTLLGGMLAESRAARTLVPASIDISAVKEVGGAFERGLGEIAIASANTREIVQMYVAAEQLCTNKDKPMQEFSVFEARLRGTIGKIAERIREERALRWMTSMERLNHGLKDVARGIASMHH